MCIRDRPRAVIISSSESELYVMSRSQLFRFEVSEGDQPWVQVAEHELDGDPSLKGVVAVSGSVLLVSRDERPIELFNRETLEPLAQVPLSDRLIPTSVAGIGEGRFLLLTSDGRCRLVAPESGDGKSYGLSGKVGPNTVEAITYNPKQDLIYLAHHTDQVDLLDSGDLSIQGQIRPSLGVWRRVDKYLIGPLRFVIPQTGELGDTISSIVSGKSAVMLRGPSGEERIERYDILRPVFSCALFIVVMLTINCVYFGTRDY